MLPSKRRRVSLTKKKKTNSRMPFKKLKLGNNDTSNSLHMNSTGTVSVTFGLIGVRNNSDEDILKAIRKISKVS